MLAKAHVLVALAALAAGVAASYESTGSSALVDGIYYFISPFPEGDFNASQESPLPLGLVPVTVVAEPVPESQLPDVFVGWAARDDVWQPGFLNTVFLAGAAPPRTRRFRRGLASTVVPLSAPGIPSGPYFMDAAAGRFHRAYRLYPDFAGAFSQSLLARPDGRFQTLSALAPASAALSIGVPSRLYFTPTAQQPLAGVRIAVKEIFDLAGVRKSNGNRAWYHLYPAAEATGTAMGNLLAAGAVVIGMQKSSQFANGELATADWVDFHAPFNPRGDGYQDAASSSAGAGAAVASYPWLDVAVGSDTGGSIRGPASVDGVFGNRPTRGLVSLDHAMSLSTRLDTVGLLARDAALWDTANQALYGVNYTSVPARPVYPDTVYLLDFPAANDSAPAAAVQRKFAADLAAFANASLVVLDLGKEWEASGPVERASSRSLSEMLNTTYAAMIGIEQARLLRDPFYRDYAAVHDGRRPFVDPVPLARWAWADAQPPSTLADAVRNKTLFMDWFNTRILPPAPAACSSALLLHTDSGAAFVPRNRYHAPPAPPFGFVDSLVSVFAEVPDSALPVGQTSAWSPVTAHDELLPVSIDVVAARGCDGLLARLARDLVDAGILAPPQPGAGLGGGEVLLRRGP